MKFEHHLSDEQKRQLGQLTGTNKDKKRDKKPKKKKRAEKLSKSDICELMGMNRDIFTRRNGAVRRK